MILLGKYRNIIQKWRFSWEIPELSLHFNGKIIEQHGKFSSRDQFSEHSTIRLCENLDDGLASVFGPDWGPKAGEEMGKTKPNRKSHGNRMEETWFPTCILQLSTQFGSTNSCNKETEMPHLPAWYVMVGTHFSIWRHAMNNALNSRFFYRYLAQILFSTQFCFSRIGS